MATSYARPCAPDDMYSVGVPAEFGNGGQRNAGTVSSERVVADASAALIVSTTVGWPITGGIPAALRLLITLLHSIGFAVYCTVYKMTGHDQNFCRKVGLNMIKPKPPIHLRREQPAISWLHNAQMFYNDLLKLENIKVVFGLDMVTSPPAEEIQREYFPNAAFCLINVFSHDNLESSLDYEHDELELWRQLYFQLSKNCSAIFSIGSTLFQYFTLEYQAKELLVKFNHYRLLHYPDEDNFRQAVPKFLPSGEHFQILTLVDDNDIADLTSESILGKAMYAMAENLTNMHIDPPTWKILGVRKGREDEVIARLNPHHKQKIKFKPFPPADFDHELKTSQVVLVPPSSPNSVDLSLNAMTLCKPVIIPAGSPSHTPVKQYIREFEADIVVDMQGNFENLKARIINTVVKYKQCLKKAAEIREKLKPIVAKVKGIMRQMIIDVIEQHTDSICEEFDVSPDTSVEENTTDGQQSQLTEEGEINEVVTRGTGNEETVEEVQDQPFTEDSGNNSNTNPSPNPTRLHDAQQPVTTTDLQPRSTTDQLEDKRGHDGVHHKENHGHGQYESSPRNNEESREIPPSSSDNPANNAEGHDCMSIHLQVRDGVPEDDKHMDEVQRDLFRHESTHENSVAYMRRVVNIHSDLRGDDVGEGSLIFRVKCGSSAAAKALWASYGNGRLDKMADDTFLTLNLMDDIGARCLSLETLIDYNDYSSCLEYLKEKELRLSIGRSMSHKERDLNTLKERKLHLISEKNTVEMQNDILKVQFSDKTFKRHGLFSDLVRERDIYGRETTAISKELSYIKSSTKQPTGKEKLEEVLEWQTSRLVKLKAMYSTHTGEIDEFQVAMGRLQQDKPLYNTIRVLMSRYGKKASGEVFDPQGLTINQNGHVVVCDHGPYDQPGSVKTITADSAQIVTSVTVHGLPHNFKPKDTKMADNGDLYTADDGNKCITVSDSKSRVKQIIAMGKLKYPTGVFVDKDRNVFIADYDADCVIKCNGDGDIMSSQQLSGPRSLTMDSKYQLIVSCRGVLNCIYVLDRNLEILNQFGSDHLETPWGVTVDNADNIYVADHKKVVKFDRQGEYQETVSVDNYPYYVAVFTDGSIVYSDNFTVKVIYK